MVESLLGVVVSSALVILVNRAFDAKDEKFENDLTNWQVTRYDSGVVEKLRK
jgi:hypothetical protein